MLGRSDGPGRDCGNAARPTIITRKAGLGLKPRLMILDGLAVIATLGVLSAIAKPYPSIDRRWGAALVATVVTLIAMHVFGLYRSRLCAQPGIELARIAAAVVVGALTLELLRAGRSRSYIGIVLVAGSCVLAVMVVRWAFRQWLRGQRVRGRHLRGLVMVGTNEDALAVRNMLRSEPELGYEVRGVIGTSCRNPDWVDLPSGRAIEQLPEIADRTDASGVVLVANALSAAEVHQVIEVASARGLHVQVWPGFRGLGSRRVRRLPMSGEMFLYVEPGRRRRWELAAKRAVDLIGASVGLLISAPVLLLAWGAIRLEDGGPGLYHQVRVGLNGKPFVMHKLRTMAPNADEAVDSTVVNERTDGPLYKAAHDPRATRVGAALRALSIDELPQFFNVLKGTMSLVGPRPALPDEVAQFDAELLRRHMVKPGITGLWQLEARDNPSFRAYRRLDLLYVDNWSIGLDLFILLATVPVLIMHMVSTSRPERSPREVPSEAQ